MRSSDLDHQSHRPVSQKTSHAQLIGYCKGHPKTKGYRIYSIDFPIPTITSFGNILVSQEGRVRYLSIEEMARASSFVRRQVAHLKYLETQGMGGITVDSSCSEAIMPLNLASTFSSAQRDS